MIRMFTQVLVGLMLFFAVMTLFPKSALEFRNRNRAKGVRFMLLGLAALLFSLISFYHVWLFFKQ